MFLKNEERWAFSCNCKILTQVFVANLHFADVCGCSVQFNCIFVIWYGLLTAFSPVTYFLVSQQQHQQISSSMYIIYPCKVKATQNIGTIHNTQHKYSIRDSGLIQVCMCARMQGKTRSNWNQRKARYEEWDSQSKSLSSTFTSKYSWYKKCKMYIFLSSFLCLIHL